VTTVTENGDHGRRDDRDRTKPWLIAALFVLAIALAVLLTLLLTRDDDDETTAGTTTTSLVGRTTTSVGAAPSAPAPAPAPTADDDAQPSPDAGEEIVPPDAEVPEVTVSCAPDVMLTAVGGTVDGTPVQVVASGCTGVAGGYAYARVVPADPTLIADPVTVWFRSTSPPTGWAVIDYGSGIECSDLAIPVAACADMGV
jgi:hypothetical protein